MQSRHSFVGNLFLILVLVFALSPLARAVVPNRISSVTIAARTPLQNAVSPRARSSVDLGVAPASLKLNDLMMEFSQTPAQQAALTQLMADQKNPASPRYHQWLTPQQYGEQFGLSAADISKVTSWLTSQGFTVTGVAKSSNFVTFSGTAAQVQQGFGTTLHTLTRNGQSHIANLTDPVLPSVIASVVANISGLNDFHPMPHLRVNPVPAKTLQPHFTNPNPTSNVPYALAPADFNAIYNVTPLISSDGFSGAGIGGCSSSSTTPCGDIAVVGQVDIAPYFTDIDAFRNAAGLSAGRPTVAYYGTNPGAPTSSCVNNPSPQASCADLEESLFDVEWAGAIAPSAKILFVTSTNVLNSLGAAIVDNVAPIISMSYGQCEPSFPGSYVAGFNLFLQQASLQGITIIGATGDDGATDCDTFVNSATQGLAVDFPGSSPYVTGIGGTMFDDTANPSTYWNSTNGAGNGSAKGYIPETVWNETTQDIAKTPPTFGAGGGGRSVDFLKPAWQKGNGVPNDSVRHVPDISLNAASDHEGYLFCIDGSCSPGLFYNTSDPSDTGYILGGTSSGAPAFASVMALVEESLHQGRLGNINPNIYAMANGPQYNSIFHDITTGNNNSPCTAGKTDCPSGGTIGYTAGPGYDQASGWGSIDAAVFAQQWISFPPTNPAGTIATTTNVVPTPATVAAGTPVSLAITVTPVTQPTNAPPYDPTGSVQIQVDRRTVAASVPLTNGSVSGTLSTTGLTAGPHTVTVTYSGDSNFASSTGTATIHITVQVATNTTVAATPNPAAAGTPIALAITVAPASASANSPTGTVQIQVNGTTVASSVTVTNGHASYSLNTTGLAAGSYPVTVTYSGDSNFTGSQGMTTITITATGTGSGGTTSSLTTVVPTPNSAAAGTPISLAITVAPGSTTANSPSGTVQILVDGSGVATSVAVTSGHASYSLNTSALTGGSHTVTAIYSGDTNFTGSQGSTQIAISVPAVGSDFTITPSTASVSAIIGEKLPPVVLKLTPVNGFTGPITLTTSDTSGDQLTPAFSVNPVVINSANGATTTLTFQTFTSVANARGEGQIFRHTSNGSPVGKGRWYAAGGGATLACMFLLVLPRRRRWGALLAVLVSIGAIGASGCGSGGTLPTSATYNITITATAPGNLVHTSMVNVTFRIR